jgi:hypothetical protein
MRLNEMDDHALLDVLAGWPGRVPTQLAFEARGFLIPRALQNRTIEFCGEHQTDLLHRYWDEVALETMRCAGKVNPDARMFHIEPKYRSAFLDELFAVRDFVELPYRNPPLVRCLFEHMKRTSSDAEFRESEVAFRRGLQEREGERLGIQAPEWTGKKRGVIPYVDEFCTALGFSHRRNRWQKKLDCHLVFEVSIDLGGSPHLTMLPLIFRIFHETDPEFAIEMDWSALFEQLIYGSWLYSVGATPRDRVLGIRAQIELFDVIAASFETS